MNEITPYHRMLMGWALVILFAIVFILGSRVWDLREDTIRTQDAHSKDIAALKEQVQLLTKLMIPPGGSVRQTVEVNHIEALKQIFPSDEYQVAPDLDGIDDLDLPMTIDLQVQRNSVQ